MQAAELAILNWIQAYLRCGLLDTMLPWVTHLCDHGEIWILLAAMLLAFPKTRRAGACVACALVLDLLLCNIWLKPMIGRIRPFVLGGTAVGALAGWLGARLVQFLSEKYRTRRL